MAKHSTRYGILDDFQQVIRWTLEKPVGRLYVTEKRLIEPKPSKYEKAMSLCGEALL